MKFITGHNFQKLASVYISKHEHYKFEYDCYENWIDVDNFDFENFDNPKWVYVNSSLLSDKKKLLASDIRGKLKKFKNPFYLILHNSDQNFETNQSDILYYKNIIKVFSQNVNFKHDKLIPIPIGIANSNWWYGDVKIFDEVLETKLVKENLIHCSFTVTGGLRDVDRLPCKKRLDELGLPLQKYENLYDYLLNLKRSKFCVCPQGNGYDTHRMWESLYMKTIPIVKRSEMINYWEKMFPMIVVDDWNELDISYLEYIYLKLSDWKNYNLLDFDVYSNKFLK